MRLRTPFVPQGTPGHIAQKAFFEQSSFSHATLLHHALLEISVHILRIPPSLPQHIYITKKKDWKIAGRQHFIRLRAINLRNSVQQGLPPSVTTSHSN